MYANLFPIVVLIVLLIGGGYLLAKDDIKLPFQDSDAVRVRRIANFPTVVPVIEENIEKQRRIIKSQDELNKFLNDISPESYLKVTETINFNREFVIAVSSDTHRSGGHDIKIRKIYSKPESNKLTVSVRERFPGKTCVTTQELNVAIDLITIRNTDATIDFERVKEVYECND